jgi:glycosyltransferase involved in cell wall biosynthesis
LKIIVIGTACWTFEKFRGTLLKNLVSQGNEVIAIGTNREQASLEFLESIGVQYYEVQFERTRYDIFSLIASIRKIIIIVRKHKPDVCLAYFLKPIVIATFVKFFYHFRLTSLIEGLGHTFTGKKRTMQMSLAKYFLQFILRFSDKVICLNNRDKEELFPVESTDNQEKVTVLPGIGVDLNYYEFSAMQNSQVNFLFLSRLLKAKGLMEFIDAASEFKDRRHKATFSVYGQVDDSVHGVEPEILINRHNDGYIHYGGLVHDVREAIKSAHVLVLPTFYREGLPRCIQEAMAMGRPVITTDFSGCSEIIEEKLNGIIVPSHDVSSLVEAIEWYCNNQDDFKKFAIESRKTAEKYFDCRKSELILQKILVS